MNLVVCFHFLSKKNYFFICRYKWWYSFYCSSTWCRNQYSDQVRLYNIVCMLFTCFWCFVYVYFCVHVYCCVHVHCCGLCNVVCECAVAYGCTAVFICAFMYISVLYCAHVWRFVHMCFCVHMCCCILNAVEYICAVEYIYLDLSTLPSIHPYIYLSIYLPKFNLSKTFLKSEK